jgi:uncharacterized membrane protein HdeD (DUF308 family)
MMSEPQSVEAKHPERRAAFWITLVRSVLALALGLALVLQPDKTRPFVVNFIGVFWLAAGIMSLRWGISGERARRMSVVVGIVGIVAGVLILGRYLLVELVGEAPIVLLLGTIIALTGLVHVFEGFRTGPAHQRQRSWTSTLLGAFEILLGLVVLLWRDDFGPIFYAVVTIWAFLAAFVLLREALRQRAHAVAHISK